MRSISLDLLLTCLLLLLNGCNCHRVGRIDLTTANRKWAESKNSIRIKICQENAPERNCCRTKILPGTYKRNQITQFTSSLGSCTLRRFDVTRPIQLTIFSRRRDSWKGRGVTIYDWNQDTNSWSEMFNCPMRIAVKLGSKKDRAVVDCQPSE